MEVINKIEDCLSEILSLVDEKTYLDIINNNEYLKLYDQGMKLEEDNIFHEEFLNKVLLIVNTKLDSLK